MNQIVKLGYLLAIVLVPLLTWGQEPQQVCGTAGYTPVNNVPLSTPKSVDTKRLVLLNLVALRKTSNDLPSFEDALRQSIDMAIEEARIAYEPMGIEFVYCDPQIVYDDAQASINYDNPQAFLDNYINPYAINCFFVDDIIESGPISIAGFAPTYFLSTSPSLLVASKRRLVVQNYTSTSTFVHELGHFFGLNHTHHGEDPGDGVPPELVSGNGCHFRGDKFCDTPADPNLFGQVSYGTPCVYTGTDTDSVGDFYSPDVTNYMSYSIDVCRTSFSPQQQDFIFTRKFSSLNGHRLLMMPPVTLELSPYYILNNSYMDANGYPPNCFIPLSLQPTTSPKTLMSYKVRVQNAFGVNNTVDLLGMKEVVMDPGFSVAAADGNDFLAHIGFDCDRYAYPFDWFPTTQDYMPISNEVQEMVNNWGVNSTAGVENNTDQNFGIQIFPNPNNGSFTLALDSFHQGANVEVYNSLGIKIVGRKISKKQTQIHMPDSSTGVHFVRIQMGNVVNVQKIVIQ